MSEFSESTEVITELVLEEDQHDRNSKHLHWHTQVAFSTLLMALFTAVGALLAGVTAHEALLDRTQELIDISIAENDRVSTEVLKAKVEILAELGEPPDPADLARIETFETGFEQFKEATELEEGTVQSVSSPHLALAVSVALLSVGITLSGMSIIVEQKTLWIAGLVVGVIGSLGVVYGILILVL